VQATAAVLVEQFNAGHDSDDAALRMIMNAIAGAEESSEDEP
jgi:hypothetical protein